MSTESNANNESYSSGDDNQNEENENENLDNFSNSIYFSNFYIENNVESINASEIFNNMNNNINNNINYGYNTITYYNYNPFLSILDNSDLFARIFMNSIINNLEEQILEEVMENSLNESKSLEKTDDFINFEKQKYDSNNEFMKKHIDCSICLVEFSDDNDISITNCKHIFHNDCIVEWSKYKKDCPICRENLSKNDILS